MVRNQDMLVHSGATRRTAGFSSRMHAKNEVEMCNVEVWAMACERRHPILAEGSSLDKDNEENLEAELRS